MPLSAVHSISVYHPATQYCSQYFSRLPCLSVLFTVLQQTTVPLSTDHSTSVEHHATQYCSQYFSRPPCHSVLFTILQQTTLPLSTVHSTSVQFNYIYTHTHTHTLQQYLPMCYIKTSTWRHIKAFCDVDSFGTRRNHLYNQ